MKYNKIQYRKTHSKYKTLIKCSTQYEKLTFTVSFAMKWYLIYTKYATIQNYYSTMIKYMYLLIIGIGEVTNNVKFLMRTSATAKRHSSYDASLYCLSISHVSLISKSLTVSCFKKPIND